MTYQEYSTLKLGDYVKDKRTGEVGQIRVFSRDEIYVAFTKDCLTSYCLDDYNNLKEFKEEIKYLEKV